MPLSLVCVYTNTSTYLTQTSNQCIHPPFCQLTTFYDDMAAQSKLLPPSRSLKTILSDLTSLYLKHRPHISRGVYITLFIPLVHRVHNAISEQKAAIRRQAEIRETSGPKRAE